MSTNIARASVPGVNYQPLPRNMKNVEDPERSRRKVLSLPKESTELAEG
jgi:hypothetical protein